MCFEDEAQTDIYDRERIKEDGKKVIYLQNYVPKIKYLALE